ncbi:MAG: hypothetical protein HKL82_09895 [Acidimicrobiaceae bacterium]|nr:hypothetical protein [Acidimicrobiaceae bacterium]
MESMKSDGWMDGWMDGCVYRANSIDFSGIGTPQLDDTVLVLLVGAVIAISIAVNPKIHSSVDASSDNFGWVTASVGVRAKSISSRSDLTDASTSIDNTLTW